MLRKLLGFVSGVLALGSSMFVVMAIADLLGASTTEPGVLLGLVVFFGGLTALTGWSAVRLLREPRALAAATTTTATSTATTTTSRATTHGIDIALEAQILALAARSAGRITATEIAIGCQVSLDAASRALDLLCARGHADLAVTPDGDTVYVIKGFISVQEKALAEALVG